MKRQKNHIFDMVLRKKNSLAESRGSSSFLSFRKILIVNFGHFSKNFIYWRHLEPNFPPGGKSLDLTDSCFPYTFGPIFIPPIHFRSNSSFFLNQFLANSEFWIDFTEKWRISNFSDISLGSDICSFLRKWKMWYNLFTCHALVTLTWIPRRPNSLATAKGSV